MNSKSVFKYLALFVVNFFLNLIFADVISVSLIIGIFTTLIVLYDERVEHISIKDILSNYLTCYGILFVSFLMPVIETFHSYYTFFNFNCIIALITLPSGIILIDSLYIYLDKLTKSKLVYNIIFNILVLISIIISIILFNKINYYENGIDFLESKINCNTILSIPFGIAMRNNAYYSLLSLFITIIFISLDIFIIFKYNLRKEEKYNKYNDLFIISKIAVFTASVLLVFNCITIPHTSNENITLDDLNKNNLADCFIYQSNGSCTKTITKTKDLDYIIDLKINDTNDFEYTKEYINNIIKYYQNNGYIVGNTSRNYYYVQMYNNHEVKNDNNMINEYFYITSSNDLTKRLSFELNKYYEGDNMITKINIKYIKAIK